jgi:hypothetical protein
LAGNTPGRVATEWQRLGRKAPGTKGVPITLGKRGGGGEAEAKLGGVTSSPRMKGSRRGHRSLPNGSEPETHPGDGPETWHSKLDGVQKPLAFGLSRRDRKGVASRLTRRDRKGAKPRLTRRVEKPRPRSATERRGFARKPP